MKVWPWDWPVVTLNDNLAKNQWHIWNQHPWIRYIRCVTSILKKVNYIGCHKVFAWPSRWPWEKSYRWMILKMVKIHQVDYIDDISKGFVDGGDRSIKSLLRHSVNREHFKMFKRMYWDIIKGILYVVYITSYVVYST